MNSKDLDKNSFISDEILGKRIKELRENREMTQYKLAERISVSNNHISRIENGKTHPSLEVLYRISQVLNVPIEYFTVEESFQNEKAIYARIKEKLNLCSLITLNIVDEILDTLIKHQNKVFPDSLKSSKNTLNMQDDKDFEIKK